MTRKPSVFDPSDFQIADKTPAPAVAASSAPLATRAAEAGQAGPSAKRDDAMFRTSLYLSRAVHDCLREIAHVERKSVHDLIREGLDHVLTSRLHPSVAELAERRKT